MSLIGKKVTYTNGRQTEKYIGNVLDKYEKAVSWSTGIGHAYGTNTYYIVRLDNGDIKHVDPDKIIEVL